MELKPVTSQAPQRWESTASYRALVCFCCLLSYSQGACSLNVWFGGIHQLTFQCTSVSPALFHFVSTCHPSRHMPLLPACLLAVVREGILTDGCTAITSSVALTTDAGLSCTPQLLCAKCGVALKLPSALCIFLLLTFWTLVSLVLFLLICLFQRLIIICFKTTLCFLVCMWYWGLT